MADNYALLKLGLSWTALKVLLESRVKLANQIKRKLHYTFRQKTLMNMWIVTLLIKH